MLHVGMGWDGMVIIGRRSSKSTFGAHNRDKGLMVRIVIS